jgi:chromosome segregation ATPase
MSATTTTTGAGAKDISNANKDVDESKLKVSVAESKISEAKLTVSVAETEVTEAMKTVKDISSQLRAMAAGDPNEEKKRRDLADAKDSLATAYSERDKAQERLDKFLQPRCKTNFAFRFKISTNKSN